MGSPACFTTGGASNRTTEAVNLTIKQIKRVGRGFTNFDNYRRACCCAAASTCTINPLPV